MATSAPLEKAATTRNRSGTARRWLRRLMPFMGILFVLVIWQAPVTSLEVPTYLLSKPTDILETLISDFDKILKHALVTSYEMSLGYLLAIIVVVPLAVFITISPTFDRFITPILLVSQTMPKIAFAPLFLIWFGVGPLPKVLVAFLISVFPIVVDLPRPRNLGRLPKHFSDHTRNIFKSAGVLVYD